MALVNQQAIANGNPPLGFVNPAIYNIGVGSGYNAAFHDIISGGNGGFTAVKGYDLVTGWGSPNGTGLINALAGSSGPNFTLSASPGSVTITQGSSGTSTITVTDVGGFSGSVTLSASGSAEWRNGRLQPESHQHDQHADPDGQRHGCHGDSHRDHHRRTSGSLTNTTTVSLTVNPSGGTPAVTLSPTSLMFGGARGGVDERGEVSHRYQQRNRNAEYQQHRSQRRFRANDQLEALWQHLGRGSQLQNRG